jgi:hypothetical protein
VGIQSIFSDAAEKLPQWQPAKKKNNKNCLTRTFAKRPPGAPAAPFITSRNYLKNHRNFFQREELESPRGVPVNGRIAARQSALSLETKVETGNKKPGAKAGFAVEIADFKQLVC